MGISKLLKKIISLSGEALSPSPSGPLIQAMTVCIGNLTDKQIKFLKDSVSKGILPEITWLESKADSFDEAMKTVLTTLHSEEAKAQGYRIERGYDYAWIKIAYDCGPIPERHLKSRFMSTPQFVKYIRSLGFKDIAGSKTLNKFIADARWHKDSKTLTFKNLSVNALERRRRNRIVQKFLEIMNEV